MSVLIFWLILACMLEIQLSLCCLAKNLTGMSGGSHLYLKPYKFCLSRHSYTGVGHLTTSIKYHQRSGMRCLNFIEVSVIRPPSEAALRQYTLRASFQTKVWHASCLAKPPLPSPMEYGWQTVKYSLHPVYFEETCQQNFSVI
jgi:hypothetical protein